MTTLRANSPKGKSLPTHELIHNLIFIKGNVYEFVCICMSYLLLLHQTAKSDENYLFSKSQP